MRTCSGLHSLGTQLGIVKNPFQRKVSIIFKDIRGDISGSKRKGKKVLKIHLPETEHLIFGPLTAVPPPESSSVEDSHGSRVLGPLAQRPRR